MLLWIRAMGANAKQNGTQGRSGFDADTHGYMFGADGKVNEDIRVGFGYAYHKTDADTGGRDTDIKGHTVFVYGKYQPKQAYIRGIATYNMEDYQERANIGGIGVRADYNVHGLGMEGYVGYENYNGVVPELGLKYNRIMRDAYTDNLGQHIETKDIDVLTAVAAIKYKSEWELDTLTVKPMMYVGGMYDVLSDENEAIVSFSGTSYNIKGQKLNRVGMTAGIDLEIEKGDWSGVIGYDVELRKDYTVHSGSIDLRYHF